MVDQVALFSAILCFSHVKILPNSCMRKVIQYRIKDDSMDTINIKGDRKLDKKKRSLGTRPGVILRTYSPAFKNTFHAIL